MADQQYLADVHDAIRVMESALRDVQQRLDLAWQRGECFRPEWNEIATEAKRLSQRCLSLASAIDKVQWQQN